MYSSMSWLWINGLGTLLQTWTNFNPSMDVWLHLLYSLGWNDLSIPKFQQCCHWNQTQWYLLIRDRSISPILVFSIFSWVIKKSIAFWLLSSYLTCGTSAQPWWHLSNKNKIWNIYHIFFISYTHMVGNERNFNIPQSRLSWFELNV